MAFQRPIRIAVAGDRSTGPDRLSLAHAVGERVGKRGGVLVCGGMGGVMQAAAQGCTEAGGIVVGILPGDDASEANPYVTIPIVTAMQEGRNAIIARSGDALIAIGGSYGTLSEVALALRAGVPVIGLDTWPLDPPDGTSDPVDRVKSAEEAVERAWSAAALRRADTEPSQAEG